jgi:hypothetical protein
VGEVWLVLCARVPIYGSGSLLGVARVDPPTTNQDMTSWIPASLGSNRNVQSDEANYKTDGRACRHAGLAFNGISAQPCLSKRSRQRCMLLGDFEGDGHIRSGSGPAGFRHADHKCQRADMLFMAGEHQEEGRPSVTEQRSGNSLQNSRNTIERLKRERKKNLTPGAIFLH